MPPEIVDPNDEPSSLFPEKLPKGKFENIPLAKLRRLKIAGPAPTAAMLDTVKNWGILQPLLVFRKDAKSPLKVGDGLRRLQCAIALSLKTVPCMVYSDEIVFRSALTLIANNQRSANPLAELKAIRELTKKSIGISEIAEITGIANARIRQRLELETLPEELMDGLLKQKLSFNVAYAVVKLPKVYREKLAEAFVQDGCLTMTSVSNAKSYRRDEAAAALPESIFAPTPSPLSCTGDGPSTTGVCKCGLPRAHHAAFKLLQEHEAFERLCKEWFAAGLRLDVPTDDHNLELIFKFLKRNDDPKKEESGNAQVETKAKAESIGQG